MSKTRKHKGKFRKGGKLRFYHAKRKLFCQSKGQRGNVLFPKNVGVPMVIPTARKFFSQQKEVS